MARNPDRKARISARRTSRARHGAAHRLALAGLVAGGVALPGMLAAQEATAPSVPGISPSADLSPVRLGGFGLPQTVFPGDAPADPGRAWSIFGSIGADIVATNNLFQTARDRRSEVFFRITPTIGATANTERVLANVLYAPTALQHATYSGQNRITHAFMAQSNLALIPDSLFLDIQGFGGVQVAGGGYGPEGATLATRSNQIQTYDARISPYAVFRFGSFAAAQIGYAFTYSSREGDRQFLPGQTLPFFVSQTFTGHRGYAVLRTGEDFGRVALVARVDGTSYSGDGIFDGAHRVFADIEARYAITRNFAVLAGGGYESQAWNTLPRTTIDEPIWTVGVRYASPGGSLIVARYGRRDGFNSASLNANVEFGGSLSLQANYSERLSTAALFTQDLLTSTTVDELGNAVDSQSRALVPVAPAIAFGSLLSAQTSLMRSRIGSAFLTQRWPRDTFSLGVVWREQTPVATAANLAAFSERGYSVLANWTHEISPRTSNFVYLQYGRTEASVRGTSDFLTLSAGLIHRLTERLQANVQVLGTQRWSAGPAGDVSSVTLLAGIRHSF